LCPFKTQQKSFLGADRRDVGFALGPLVEIGRDMAIGPGEDIEAEKS
jgi:hypothetical protein